VIGKQNPTNINILKDIIGEVGQTKYQKVRAFITLMIMKNIFIMKDKLMVNQMVKAMLFLTLVNGNMKELFEMVKHMVKVELKITNKVIVFKVNGEIRNHT
jgi:hypothetical protein